MFARKHEIEKATVISTKTDSFDSWAIAAEKTSKMARQSFYGYVERQLQ